MFQHEWIFLIGILLQYKYLEIPITNTRRYELFDESSCILIFIYIRTRTIGVYAQTSVVYVGIYQRDGVRNDSHKCVANSFSHAG